MDFRPSCTLLDVEGRWFGATLSSLGGCTDEPIPREGEIGIA